MTSFTDVFTGSPVSPGETSYRAFSISADTTLTANDRSTSVDSAARVMDVTATAGSLTLRLPPANQLGVGFAYIVTNAGANTFTLAGNGGAVLASISAGQQWQFYVTDNTSAAGAWRAVQFGSTTGSATAGALAGAGLKAEGSLLSVKQELSTFNSTITAGTGDRGKVLTWTGGAGTLNLPAAGTVGADWVIGVKNAGSGTLSITPASGTIDGASSVQLAPTESTYIVTDGSNYYTIGAGRSSSFSFTYLSVDVAGTGSYTLSSVQQNKTVYNFTGTLTGNRTVIVPNTVQQYWIDNATSGAYTLTVKTAAGSGVAVSQGQRAILYCDGTNVLDADTAGISTPIAIADGGTGGTTASAARTNLGATSVGGALFTAASASAARSTLGASATGDSLFTAASASAARSTLGASATGDSLFTAASASAARSTLGAGATGDSLFTAANVAAVYSVIGSGRSISTTAPLSGGGDLSANRTLSISANGITNSLLATMAANTVKANVTGSTATPNDVAIPSLLDVVGSTRGSIYFRGAADLDPLVPNTVGFVLRDGGSGADPSWGAGVVLGTYTTASGTSVDFTGIPAWARRIVVSLVGVSTNGTTSVGIQLGDSGGIETSGYSCGVFDDGATANFTAGFFDNSSSAAIVRHGQFHLALADAATNTWTCMFILGYSNAASGRAGGGSKATSAALDRIRLTTSGGGDTFDAGSVNIVYW
jgi:hypothetical protein